MNKNCIRALIAVVASFCVVLNMKAQTFASDTVIRMYVTSTGAGFKDGSSWKNAASDLQWAIDTLSTVSETGIIKQIWVAAGTYYGDSVVGNNAFTMVEGVNVYGGFFGSEPADYDLRLRDLEANATILDGQQVQRVLSQNTHYSATGTTIWDGFTIQNGKVNGNGGGVYLMSNSVLQNCKIQNNMTTNYTSGGGIYATGNATGSIQIKDCEISNNSTYYNGGGIYANNTLIIGSEIHTNNSSSYGGGVYMENSEQRNCKIHNNISGSNGGGVYLYDSKQSNCLINNNSSKYRGGGVYSYRNSTFINCDIVNNQSTEEGGGIYNSESNNTYTNCIIWGNKVGEIKNQISRTSTITYSAIEGGYAGQGNIGLMGSNTGADKLSPQFVSPTSGAGTDYTGGDWRLREGSICINYRDTLGLTLPETDMAGEIRVQQGKLDLGCYETSYKSVSIPVYTDGIIYVTETGSGKQDGTSWENSLSSIQEGLMMAVMSDTLDIWVSKGTYYGDSVVGNNAFTMVEGVNVYGGFFGNEPADYDLRLRDLEANATILDGQQVQRVLSQNTHYSATGTTIWDGFTIQNGKVNGNGGGVYLMSNSVLQNCKIQNNMTTNYTSGGGIYATGNATGSIQIKDCEISNNSTYYNGGGIYANNTLIIGSEIHTNNSSSYGGGVYMENSEQRNCKIHNNISGSNGGGVYLYNSKQSNCLINNNSSKYRGGGVYSYRNSTSINCDIVNNQSTEEGGGIYNSESNNTYTNCIIWGNKVGEIKNQISRTSTITYSAIEGGYAGQGNIGLMGSNTGADKLSPQFVSPTSGAGTDYTGGDWRLSEGSICINYRDTLGLTLPETDMAGEIRVQQGKLDLGCYETSYKSVSIPVYTDGIIYVTETGSGKQDGTSWENSLSSIQEGLMMAVMSDTLDIWVSKGTYYGDSLTINNAFTMVEGVNVYGGFAGEEPADYDLSLRDIEANATILDGQQVQRVLSQNTHYSATGTTIWDGFTIQNGKVNGNGGGVYLMSNSVLQNCKIQNNMTTNYTSGGGIYATGNATGSIQIKDCEISNNSTYYYGGGIYANNTLIIGSEIHTNNSSSYGGGVYMENSEQRNCKIHNNISGSNGGGVYLYNSKQSNCLINNNSSKYRGGGVYSYRNSTSINCDIVNNQSTEEGGGIYNSESNNTYTNCIIWGNKVGEIKNQISRTSTITYSAIEGGYAGQGNIGLMGSNTGADKLSPQFVSPTSGAGTDYTGGDWRLSEGSICINYRDTLGLTLPETDMAGEIRVQQGKLDLGCYETSYKSVSIPVYTDGIIYVTETGSGKQDGTSWENSLSSIQEGLMMAVMSDTLDIWVSKGTYYGDSLTINNAFTMVEGVNVYGGFAGEEPADYDLSLRDIEANATILDGQQVQRVLSQNTHYSATGTTIWDGFTIQNGKVNGNGGGVYLMSNSVLQNCKIQNNMTTNYTSGGGIYATGNATGSIQIKDCEISNNSTYYYGGGIYANNTLIIGSEIHTNNSSSYGGGVYMENSEQRNCKIHNNISGSNGGGVYLYNSKQSNCLINNNSSKYRGGGVYSYRNSTSINCDIVNNQSTEEGGGIYNSESNNTYTNCIIWGNKVGEIKNQISRTSTITYSAIEGGYAGQGNIGLMGSNTGADKLSPQFVSPTSGAGTDYTGGDWRLSEGSICINYRDTLGLTLPETDMAGEIRVQQGKLDLGCYETSYKSVSIPVYTDGIIYVTETGSGKQDGTSWENSLSSIQEGLMMAVMSDTLDIWVSKGTYYGDSLTINNAFTMVEGVNVYGGFAGEEPADYDLSLRDIEANATILDGQQVQRVLSQNTHYSATGTTIWDGFTIQNGKVNGNGGGVYLMSNSVLQNCKIQNNMTANYNYGGGIYATGNTTGSIQIKDCEISNNSAYYGGGIYSYNSKQINCLINNNSCNSYGGGVYSYENSTFINCDIVNNQSKNEGSGIYNSGSSNTYTNCIIWGNKKNYVVNNIYGTGTFNYCAMEGSALNGIGNISLASTNDGNDNTLYYVRFMDPSTNNYQLHPTSICIDAGDTSAMSGITSDLLDNNRIIGRSTDIGCYESENESLCPSVINLTVDNVASSSVMLSWTSEEDELKWQITFDLVDGTDPQFITISDTIFTLSGLTHNRDYMAKVRTVCSDTVLGLYSIPVYFSTKCDSSTLTLSDFTSDFSPKGGEFVYEQEVPFIWNNIPEATSYDFYLWKATGNEPSVPTLTNLHSSYVTKKLSDFVYGAEYSWKVVAHNECIQKSSEIYSFHAYELPDLHVTQITHSNPVAGQTMKVEWSVRNDGKGSTPPGSTWKDYVWIVSDADVRLSDSNDQKGKLATVNNLQSLNVGEYYTNSVDVTIPQNFMGNYYMFVFSDQVDAYNINFSSVGGFAPDPYLPDTSGVPYPYLTGSVHSQGIIDEINENDNFFYKVLEILPSPSPDLYISDITYPINAFSGSTIPLTYTIGNKGGVDAVSSWNDAFYISSEPIFNAATAEYLGSYTHVENLDKDSSRTQSVDITIPVTYMGDYYFHIKTDVTDHVFESIYENNNTTSSDASINITLAPPPDLIVSSVKMADVVSCNNTSNITYSVKNTGVSEIQDEGWYDAVYLSQLPDLDITKAILLKTVRYLNPTKLAIDSSYTNSVTVQIPDKTVGDWYVFVKTDIKNNVFEYLNESNNIGKSDSTVSIVAPDLIVSNISISEIIDVNNQLEVNWVIKNIGDGLVYKRSLRDSIYLNGMAFDYNTNTVTLYKGDSLVCSKMISLPCITAVNAELSIKANADGAIFESIESNNQTDKEVVLIMPDFSVNGITVVDSCNSGVDVNVLWNITNTGSSSISNQSMVEKIYLGTDSILNINNAFLIGTYQHNLYLNINETKSINYSVSIPDSIQGNYFIHVVTNADDNQICEGINLASNISTGEMIYITMSPYPDLLITSISTQTSPINKGDYILLDYIIRNNGIANINGGTLTNRFYLSSNRVFDVNTAIHLGDDILTPSLNVNEEKNRSISFEIPTNIESGSYFLIANTDQDNAFYECIGETNNIFTGDNIKIAVYPLDIEAKQIVGNDEVEWGQRVQYSLEAQNISSVSTILNRWIDKLYLSNDEVISDDDVELGINYHNGIVNSGNVYKSNFYVSIPYGSTGSQYLIAVVDNNRNNSEINLLNNTVVKPIVVKSVPTPDLYVSDVVVIDPIQSGQSARIAYKVTNVSQTPIISKQWSDKIFISVDESYSSSDTEIKTVTKSLSLAENQSYCDTIPVTVPLPINGNLYLIIKANTNNGIYELNQTNNLQTISVDVTLSLPGDLIVEDIISESEVLSGDKLHISWNVKNIGENALSGNGLKSLVYMSKDNQFDADDKLLGSVSNNIIILPANATINQNLTARISGVPEGEYYLVIKTDVTNSFYENEDDNNSQISEYPFYVSSRNLPFNTPLCDTLFNDLFNDYKLIVGNNTYETVRLHLHSSDSLNGAVNSIYVSHNTMGDNLNYTYSTVDQFTANPELYIPSTLPEYYGINVVGTTPAGDSQSIKIQADILPFELRTVSPNYGGNSGIVTVELTGSKFRTDMKVWLINGVDTIYADTIIFDSYYRAFAQFDLTDKPLGFYTMGALNYCEGEVFLENSFEIRKSESDRLSTNLIFPNSPRPNRNIVMMLEFGNIGNIDIKAPVIRLKSEGGAWIALSSDEIPKHEDEILIPLQIEGEPQGVLRPGSYGIMNIYCYTSGALVFSIKRVQ